jgi:hypothetical protein
MPSAKLAIDIFQTYSDDPKWGIVIKPGRRSKYEQFEVFIQARVILED